MQDTIETNPLPGAVFFEPHYAIGGAEETGTVYLNDIAPADIVVTLTSDTPQLVAVPDSVVMTAGASTGSFLVTINPVSAFTTVNVSASCGGTTVGDQVLILASSGTASVRSPTVSSANRCFAKSGLRTL